MGAPINRTAKTNLDGNLVPYTPASSGKLKASDDVIYDYVDGLNSAQDAHAQATTLAHPDGSVKTAKIADSAVTTAKIADGSITFPKLALSAQVNESVNNALVVALKAEISICPDDYSGTDIQKLQQCVDISKTQNVEILLNRIYDISGGSVNVDKGYTYSIIFKGSRAGGLMKNDNGFIFTSSIDDNQRGGLHFEQVVFKGNINYSPYVVNGDRIIGLFFNKCIFNDINCIQAVTRYLQTFRFVQNVVNDHKGYFIDVIKCYDAHITHNEIEASYHEGFLRCGSSTQNSFSAFTLNFSYNLAEGQTADALLTLADSMIGLSINNNYFEANAFGVVKFITTANAAKTGTFVFSNNFVSSSVTAITGMSLFKYYTVITARNNTFSGNFKAFDSIVLNAIIDHGASNVFYGGAKLFTDTLPFVTSSRGIIANYGATTITYTAGTGVVFSIDSFFVGDNTSYAGETFLVNVSVQYDGVAAHKNNYTGLLAFTGEYDATLSVALRMYLTSLFDKSGIDGLTSCSVTATFGGGSTKTNNNQTTLTDKRLIITVGSGANTNGAKISIVPLSQVLKQEQGYLYRSM